MPVVHDISTEIGHKSALQAALEVGCRPLFQLYNPGAKLTRSQQNLYWRWCRVAAEHWKIEASKEYPDPADAVHDVFRHKFLGTSDRKVGNTVIPDQLVSTTSLEKPEMSEYMTKVEAFCADHGLMLPIPGENEYSQYREAAA